MSSERLGIGPCPVCVPTGLDRGDDGTGHCATCNGTGWADRPGIGEDYDADETPLPGMEPATGKESPMVLAARRTLAELRELGHVKEHHAVVCAMILAASDAIDRGSKSGRASAVAMAMKELREAYLLLVPSEEGGAQGDDGWSKFETEFRKAAELG